MKNSVPEGNTQMALEEIESVVLDLRMSIDVLKRAIEAAHSGFDARLRALEGGKK